MATSPAIGKYVLREGRERRIHANRTFPQQKHLKGMKELLSTRENLFDADLRRHILEFLVYHDYSSLITSQANPLDERSLAFMEEFSKPALASHTSTAPPTGTLLGVMDGLFGFISRIRRIRDAVRQNHACARERQIMEEAFAIDMAIRYWHPRYGPDSPRYAPSLLYRQCTWLYLQRTWMPSQPCRQFEQGVDEGLKYLRELPWDTDRGSIRSILLMPLFLLGCAAFEPRQRPEISLAFQRLQEWSGFGNIKYARAIVEEIWEMMDDGRGRETWDWETVIARHEWDFLIT